MEPIALLLSRARPRTALGLQAEGRVRKIRDSLPGQLSKTGSFILCALRIWRGELWQRRGLILCHARLENHAHTVILP